MTQVIKFCRLSGLFCLLVVLGGMQDSVSASDEQADQDAGELADARRNWHLIPAWRNSYDCGRMATYNFINLFRDVRYPMIADRIPIEGSKGSSLESICDCLSEFKIEHRPRWVKPRQLCELEFPVILRLRNMRDQYHFLVVLDYQPSKDRFSVLDGETDQVRSLDGKNMRLRSTGFVVESARSAWYETPLLLPGLLCVVAAFAFFGLPNFGLFKRGNTSGE